MAVVGEILLLEQAVSTTTTVSGVGAINSAEAFGQADRVVRQLGAIGISSGEAFGRPTVAAAPHTVSGVGAIISPDQYGADGYGGGDYGTPQFGVPALAEVLTILNPAGITSAEAFGRPNVIGGVPVVAPLPPVAVETPGPFNIGDLVRLHVTFRASDSVTPADPSSIIFRVLSPGTSVACYAFGTGSVTRASVGAYYKDITPHVYGQWVCNVLATGGVQAMEETPFLVKYSAFI